jgi:hypothetical protein
MKRKLQGKKKNSSETKIRKKEIFVNATAAPRAEELITSPSISVALECDGFLLRSGLNTADYELSFYLYFERMNYTVEGRGPLSLCHALRQCARLKVDCHLAVSHY